MALVKLNLAPAESPLRLFIFSTELSIVTVPLFSISAILSSIPPAISRVAFSPTTKMEVLPKVFSPALSIVSLLPTPAMATLPLFSKSSVKVKLELKVKLARLTIETSAVEVMALPLASQILVNAILPLLIRNTLLPLRVISLNSELSPTNLISELPAPAETLLAITP